MKFNVLQLTSFARNSHDILCTFWWGNWQLLHSWLVGADGDGSLKS